MQCADVGTAVSVCRVHECAQDTFRIGVFSSASQRTVDTVVPMLEAAARQGEPSESNGFAEGWQGNSAAGGRKLRRLLQQRLFVLTRQHTEAAPQVRCNWFQGLPFDFAGPETSCRAEDLCPPPSAAGTNGCSDPC